MKMKLGMLVLALALPGCSHDPAHAGSSPDQNPATKDHLVFSGGGESFDVKVTPSSMVGAQMNVARATDGLRGEAFGQAVNVSLDSATRKVKGLIGTRPMDFRVSEGTNVQLQGLVGGRVSDFQLGPDGASGRLGVCSYQLKFTGGAYEGERNCGGAGIQQMELRIPPLMADWTSTERMAALAVFLIAR